MCRISHLIRAHIDSEVTDRVGSCDIGNDLTIGSLC
jgi:hypothetical protein